MTDERQDLVALHAVQAEIKKGRIRLKILSSTDIVLPFFSNEYYPFFIRKNRRQKRRKERDFAFQTRFYSTVVPTGLPGYV